MNYLMQINNTAAIVSNMQDVFYWLNKLGLNLTQKMNANLNANLLTGARNSIAIANNSGNPECFVAPLTGDEKYSIKYRSRVYATLAKCRTIGIPDDVEIEVSLSSNRIYFKGPKFFDRICGNGWMHSYNEYLLFDNDGRLTGSTCSDNGIARDFFKSFKK